MTAPTATRRTRTRKTSPRTRRNRRLPRLGWWWLAIALTVIGIANTWPLYTGLATALIAVATIVAVVRPRRLARPLNWATTTATLIFNHHNRLPAPGHRTLQTFLNMGHDQFEHAIAALAREDHHHVAHATKSGGTGDRGLDVLVQLHTGHRILIQCKHYTPGRNNVSGPDVREIVGSVIAHQCQYGIIVTTSDFTAEAYDTNHSLGRNALTLINGDRLAAWANGGPPPWN